MIHNNTAFNDPDDDFLNDENVSDDGENTDDLSYDEEKESYILDVDDDDPVWDHPADYNSISPGAKDDSSAYDVSNPLVGDEYAAADELRKDDFSDLGIRTVSEDSLKTSKRDEDLARNEEDERDDLDEEGYPLK